MNFLLSLLKVVKPVMDDCSKVEIELAEEIQENTRRINKENKFMEYLVELQKHAGGSTEWYQGYNVCLNKIMDKYWEIRNE